VVGGCPIKAQTMLKTTQRCWKKLRKW
jgi:hypothetical protein